MKEYWGFWRVGKGATTPLASSLIGVFCSSIGRWRLGGGPTAWIWALQWKPDNRLQHPRWPVRLPCLAHVRQPLPVPLAGQLPDSPATNRRSDFFFFYTLSLVCLAKPSSSDLCLCLQREVTTLEAAIFLNARVIPTLCSCQHCLTPSAFLPHFLPVLVFSCLISCPDTYCRLHSPILWSFLSSLYFSSCLAVPLVFKAYNTMLFNLFYPCLK